MAKLHVLVPIALYITLLVHAVCATPDPGAGATDAPSGGGGGLVSVPVGRKDLPSGSASAPSPGGDGDDEPLGSPAGAPSPSSNDVPSAAGGFGSSKLTQLPPGAFNLPAGFPMPSLGPPVGSDGLPLPPKH
ncbi:hypothetical protein ACET3Z_024699 [Daucus carota]